MLIEYRIQFGKSGLAITQRIEPENAQQQQSVSDPVIDAHPLKSSIQLSAKANAGRSLLGRGGSSSDSINNDGGSSSDSINNDGGSSSDSINNDGGSSSDSINNDGGAAAGLGTSPPIIIMGPIIIGGPWNQSSTAPASSSLPKPAWTEADTFQIEEQTEFEWCWAAVGVSINRYFRPDSKMRQCDLATKILVPLLADPKLTTGCQDPVPPKLDIQADMKDVLTFLGSLSSAEVGALSFEATRDQILSGYPVCARIGWFPGDRGHFVVIRDCAITESGEQWVDVADPFYGSSTIPYTELVNSYKSNGKWTATYLLKRP